MEAVREICDATQSLAALRDIRLEFRCAVERHICAFHFFAMEQLLYQLLSNALKFTPDGGSITVELRFASRRVLLSVADTGCGIPENQIPYLFDRYLHEDAVAPQPHGLGLGLPICQHIAEGHDGTMMAESRPGQGAGSPSPFQTGAAGRWMCLTSGSTTAADSTTCFWPWRTRCRPRPFSSGIWTDPGPRLGPFFLRCRPMAAL